MVQPSKRTHLGNYVAPLPAGWASVLFAVVYPASVIACRNLPESTTNDLRNYWSAFLVPGALVGIVLFRLLWNLLSRPWFAGTLAAAAVVAVAAASIRLPVEAAYALVYRSYAFVLLLSALGASLLACTAASLWSGFRPVRLLFLAGSLVLLAGACVNIAGWASGEITVTRGLPQSDLALNDCVLTVVSDQGDWTRVSLPLEDLSGGRTRAVEAGDLSIEVAYRGEAGETDAARFALTASDGSDTGTLSLFYNGGFAPLEIGKAQHRVCFGPSRMTLPFEIALDYAGEESINAPRRPYDAAIALTGKESGRRWCAQLKAGQRVSVLGYSVRLLSVNRPRSVSLAIDCYPGTSVLAAGAMLVILSAVLALRAHRSYSAGKRAVPAYCRAILS